MRITVKAKLGAAFGTILVLMAAAAVVAISGLSGMNETIGSLTSQSAARVVLALNVKSILDEVISDEKDMLLGDSVAARAKFQEEMVKNRNAFRDAAARLRAIADDAGRRRVDDVLTAMNRLADIEDKEWVLARQISNAAAFDLMKKEGIPAGDAVFEAAAPLIAQTATPDQTRIALQVQQAMSELGEAKEAVRDAMLTSADAETKAYLAKMNEHMDSAARLLDALRHGPAGDQVAVVESRLAAWKHVGDRMADLAMINGDAKAITLSVTEGRTAVLEIHKLVDDIVAGEQQSMEQAKAGATDDYIRLRLLLIVVTLGSLAIGIGAASWLALSISRGLGKSVDLANAVAAGDLAQNVTVTSDDEIKDLVDALNRMTANLRATAGVAEEIAKGNLSIQAKRLSDRDVLGIALETMLGKLREVVSDAAGAADNVASGSQQLSSSAEELSQGATEQAAAAEEASASMEQMAANIKQTAENASQTEKIARQSAGDAQASGEAVTRAVEAMQTIAGKITIVQEIARQTDLLALNAAVEAARAGEHGKGFAVVASEVRKLAERSQAAAAEINALSSDTVKTAEQAGQMLAKLVPDIRKTAELVEEISAACREQDVGATQVNQAIQQLDTVTQQNTAASEEMSATSEELAAQADQLQTTISYFRLDPQSARIATKAMPMTHHQPAVAHLPPPGSLKTKGRTAPAKPNGKGVRLDLMQTGGPDIHDAAYERY